MAIPLFALAGLLIGFGGYMGLWVVIIFFPFVLLPIGIYHMLTHFSPEELAMTQEASITEEIPLNKTFHEDLQSKMQERQPQHSKEVEAQLQHVHYIKLPELIDRLPYKSRHEETFERIGDYWRFKFKCNSVSHQFSAMGFGQSPMDAFVAARRILDSQLQQWHSARFRPSSGDSPTQPVYLSAASTAPRALIIDDDVDLALAMQSVLHQLGCQTEIVATHEDLHRKISFGHANYIFLDWMLNNKVTADQPLEKAVRLINTFADLRDQFRESRPRIVTYSVLDRDHVTLPRESSEYFEHLDHWQKPMQFPEVMKRVSQLLATNPVY